MQRSIRNYRSINIIFVGFISWLLLTAAQAGAPLWTIVPASGSNPSQNVPVNGASTVQYVVQNQSSKSKQLVIQPISGIVQTAVCELSPRGQAGSSCILNLAIDGGALPEAGVHGGPNVCQRNLDGSPDPGQCYQPSSAYILNITKGSQEQVGISVNPSTLALLASSGTPGFLTITNNSTSVTALDVQAILPVSWVDVIQNASSCVAIAPNGGTCQLQFTPGTTAYTTQTVPIAGSNTTQVTVQMSVNAPLASISVSPSTLDLIAGSAIPGSLTITNNSTSVTALNVQATLPGSWVDVVQDASGCTSIAPNGGTCQLQFTPGTTAYTTETVPIAGSNTTQVTAQMSVSTPAQASLSVTGGPLSLIAGCSTAGSLTVQNISAISAYNITVSLGSLAGHVNVVNSCPNPLLAGASCNISLTGVSAASLDNISIQGGNTPAVQVGVTVAAALAIGDSHLGGIVYQVSTCNVGRVVSGPLGGGSSEQFVSWSSQQVDVSGATDLSNGAANTTAIIASAGCTNATNCAAFTCRNIGTDWYLPALNELAGVRGALCPSGIPCNFGGFGAYSYWSSSQTNTNNARYINFPTAIDGSNPKIDGLPVRCIRTFTS